MIKFTPRLDKAIKTAAWAHEQVGQHRKGGDDIPYIIHPFGVMIIAGQVTDDEDILIACLFHDILEDVTTKNPEIYNEDKMREEFGDRVTDAVLDVSKDDSIKDWRERGEAYLEHLENEGSDEAVIIAAADKIHNLTSILEDYEVIGDALWERFTTGIPEDQLWWYESMIELLRNREAPEELVTQLQILVDRFKEILAKD